MPLGPFEEEEADRFVPAGAGEAAAQGGEALLDGGPLGRVEGPGFESAELLGGVEELVESAGVEPRRVELARALSVEFKAMNPACCSTERGGLKIATVHSWRTRSSGATERRGSGAWAWGREMWRSEQKRAVSIATFASPM